MGKIRVMIVEDSAFMRKAIKDGYSVCVTDCRFINEVNAIKDSFTRTPIVHIGITSDELGDKSRKKSKQFFYSDILSDADCFSVCSQF